MFVGGIKHGCYLEFQYCKNTNPINTNRVDSDIVEHWKEDSLFINDDEFEEFYRIYESIFCCGLHPNGEIGFDYYGINYYDKETTQKILMDISKVVDKEYKNLIEWLEIARTQYNGFYILGV